MRERDHRFMQVLNEEPRLRSTAIRGADSRLRFTVFKSWLNIVGKTSGPARTHASVGLDYCARGAMKALLPEKYKARSSQTIVPIDQQLTKEHLSLCWPPGSSSNLRSPLINASRGAVQGSRHTICRGGSVQTTARSMGFSC